MFEALDIPFARKVLEFAQAEHTDFTHNQRCVFFTDVDDSGHVCGTTACLAGIATMLAPNVEVIGWVGQQDFMFSVDGRQMGWMQAGAKLMGLSSLQASSLFTCLEDSQALRILEFYIKKAEEERADV
jgi:hypothetical protein